jgi:purine-cytosine permease-like protein
MVDDELNDSTGGPRRKTFTPPAEDATFTGSLPVMGNTDEFGQPLEPIPPVIPQPSAAIAAPVRTSLSDEEILARFRTAGMGSTAEMMDELEAQVTLREDEEDAFTMWANLTRATRGASAEEIIARERIVFGGGSPVAEVPEELEEVLPEPLPPETEVDQEPELTDVAEPEFIEAESIEEDSIEADVDLTDDAAVAEDDLWPLAQRDDSGGDDSAGEDDGARVVEPSSDADDEVTPATPQPPVLDQTGLEPTAENQKVLSMAGLFWMWWATLTPVLGIVAGAFLVSRGLGLLETVVAVSVAGLLSGLVIAAASYAGAKTGLSTLHTAQMTFGRHGNIVPSALVLVIRIAVVALLVLAAEALASRILDGANLWPFDGWILRASLATLIAGVVVTLALLGGRVLRVALYVSGGFSALGLVGFVVVSAPSLSLSRVSLWSASALDTLALGSLALAVFLVLFGHSGADLSRYLRSGSGSGGASALSGLVAVVPSVLFVGYVAWVAVSVPRMAITLVTDPVGTLAAELPLWYPAPLLVGLVVPLVGLASLALFSGSLATLSAGLRVGRPLATVVIAVLALGGVAAAIVLEQPIAVYVPDMLYVSGVILGAWAAAYALDVALGAKRLDALRAGSVPSWRFAPLIGMLAGIGVGFGLISPGIPWLSWLGYGYPLIEMLGLMDLSSGELGVLAAILVSGLVSAITAVILRTRNAPVAHG